MLYNSFTIVTIKYNTRNQFTISNFFIKTNKYNIKYRKSKK